VADRAGGVDPLPSWGDIARRLRALNEQMSAAARAFAVTAAKETPTALSQPMARYAQQLLAATTAITDPLRRLLDENARLAERVGQWAEQHREMADQMARWAEQQRLLTDQMSDLARPFLQQTEMLQELHTIWRDTGETSSEGGQQDSSGSSRPPPR